MVKILNIFVKIRENNSNLFSNNYEKGKVKNTKKIQYSRKCTILTIFSLLKNFSI